MSQIAIVDLASSQAGMVASSKAASPTQGQAPQLPTSPGDGAANAAFIDALAEELQAIFEMPSAARAGAHAPLVAQRAVAAENLAALQLPPQVLEALAQRLSTAGPPVETPGRQGRPTADDGSGLFEALWAVLASTPAPVEPNPVATEGLAQGHPVMLLTDNVGSNPASAVETPLPGGPPLGGEASASEATTDSFAGSVADEVTRAGGIAPGRLDETVGAEVARPQTSAPVEPTVQTSQPQAPQPQAPQPQAPQPLEVESATVETVAAPAVEPQVSVSEGARMDNGEQLVSGPPAQPGDAPADQTPTAVTGHVEPVTAQPIEPAAQAVTAEAGTFSDVVNRQAAHRIAAVGVEPVEVHSTVVEVAHGVAPSSLQASEASTSTETTAPVDQQRLIERISKVMSQSTSAGRTTIRLRLYPPELGVVRVEITSVRGEVTARLETSTAEAREILSSNLSALRDGIRAAGVDMREIEVNHREMGVDYGLSNGRHGGAPERNARQFARQSGSEQTLEQGEPPSQAAGAGVLDVLV